MNAWYKITIHSVRYHTTKKFCGSYASVLIQSHERRGKRDRA